MWTTRPWRFATWDRSTRACWSTGCRLPSRRWRRSRRRARSCGCPWAKPASERSWTALQAGEIYLVTDKGERKATGSYYTPDYIVKYIVKNTIEPVIEKKKQEWLGTSRPFADYLLSIKVLDPAMGSGPFPGGGYGSAGPLAGSGLGDSPT